MNENYYSITRCRLCGGQQFNELLNLGSMALTGVFPKSKEESVPFAPLRLIECSDINGCGLVQLRETVTKSLMFGDGYGYRSGLNPTMVEHLGNHVKEIESSVSLSPGDIVIDIASNDGTLLNSYSIDGLKKIGVDPSSKKFSSFYKEDIQRVEDYFNYDSVRPFLNGKKAKVITSLSVFYDLDSPLSFAQDIFNLLEDEGIWICEQSYLRTMLENASYDTICHEHLEYYSVANFYWIANRVGFEIIGVNYNEINGGSFVVRLRKTKNPPKIDDEVINTERSILTPLLEGFETNVKRSREVLVDWCQLNVSRNLLICGLGASTKGNVILQYCGLGVDTIPYIAEVNKDKLGCYTPGTMIPIISEEALKGLKADFGLILPWHFKRFFSEAKRDLVGSLVVPLPQLEIL